MTEPNDSKDVDYHNIDTTDMEEHPFPVDTAHEYRIHFSPDAYDDMMQHAHSTDKVEVGGVLVGDTHYDGVGPYLQITAVVPAEGSQNRDTQMTFTHETWDHINKTMDAEHPGLTILGWYHTHPGFGIFLSEMDHFIQKNFFNQPNQVAIVIDPKANIQGCFAWENGESRPLSRYWRGSEEVALSGEKAYLTDPPETAGNEPPHQPAPASWKHVRIRDIASTLILAFLLALLWFFTYRTNASSNNFDGYLASRLETALQEQQLDRQNFETRLNSIDRQFAERLADVQQKQIANQSAIEVRLNAFQDHFTTRLQTTSNEQRSNRKALDKRLDDLDHSVVRRLETIHQELATGQSSTNGLLSEVERSLNERLNGIHEQQQSARNDFDGRIENIGAVLDEGLEQVQRNQETDRQVIAHLLYDSLARELLPLQERVEAEEANVEPPDYPQPNVQRLAQRFNLLSALSPSLTAMLRETFPQALSLEPIQSALQGNTAPGRATEATP